MKLWAAYVAMPVVEAPAVPVGWRRTRKGRLDRRTAAGTGARPLRSGATTTIGGRAAMTDYLQVSTAFASKQEAAYVGRSVTHSRLAAGAQILGPVLSMLWHDGTLVETEEWQLLLRTRVERFDELTAYIVKRHPQPNPEILAVPIIPGTRSYLEWLDRMSAPG